MATEQELYTQVAAMIGDNGTGDIAAITREALADDAEVTARDIAEIVREARAEEEKGR
jgi:hypothetical protein